MKFYVSMAFNDAGEYLDLARAVEAAGWDGMAISDHLVHPETIATPYPYTADGERFWDGETPWLDPWVAISAMAAVTERIEFVTYVYILPLRHPVQVAKMVGTAAALSNNRVKLGAGLGWMAEEFDSAGQSFKARGSRTNESIEVIRLLLGGGMVEHHGKHYAFERMQMSPAPSKPVPVLLGGLSDTALRRAARLGDGWMSVIHGIDEMRDYIDTLADYRREYGREDLPFEIFGSSNELSGLDSYRRLEETGVTSLVAVPWYLYGDEPFSFEQKVEGLKRFGGEVIEKMS